MTLNIQYFPFCEKTIEKRDKYPWKSTNAYWRKVLITLKCDGGLEIGVGISKSLKINEQPQAPFYISGYEDVGNRTNFSWKDTSRIYKTWEVYASYSDSVISSRTDIDIFAICLCLNSYLILVWLLRNAGFQHGYWTIGWTACINYCVLWSNHLLPLGFFYK